MDNELIFNQVCDIILRNRGKLSKPLTSVTTLRKDLGIDGYDAEEIMVEYFTAFEIDSSQFQFETYFGPEGSNPFISIIYLFKKSTITEISRTLGRLCYEQQMVASPKSKDYSSQMNRVRFEGIWKCSNSFFRQMLVKEQEAQKS